MKISAINKCSSNLVSQMPQKNKTKSLPVTFQGKTINGHYYTDLEYVDAMTYKNKGDVTPADFRERYNAWDYWCTDKSDRHAREVNKCIADIKVEERKQKEASEEKQKKANDEKKRLHEELDTINKGLKKKEEKINSFLALDEHKGLGVCQLSKENLDTLLEEVVRPFAESTINKEYDKQVPNGVLISGKDEYNNEKLARELAYQLLKDDFDFCFKKVKYENDDVEDFQIRLNKTKEKAFEKYEKQGKKTVIYIPKFDETARTPDHDDYTPSLNRFLKSYFLNCAEQGCMIIASAQNSKDIERPFLINQQRFKVSIKI